MRRIFSILLLIILSVAPAYHSQEKPLPPLEIRFTAPLRWERGCLRGGLDIVNHSPDPLLLTRMGPYYHMALDTSKDETQRGDESEWIGIYGYTDIIIMGFNSLDAGSRVHRDFCLPPTVWVVSLVRKTRREIPVRGRLRVDVSYWADQVVLKKYENLLGASKEHPESTYLWAMSFAEIPCPKATCGSDCDRPPVGLHGESPVVPDVAAFSPEMNTRGKALTDELSRKFPPCSAALSEQEHQNPEPVDRGAVSYPLKGHIALTNVGKPVPGMLVECFVGGWKKRVAATTTDSSGDFTFPNLAEGKYFVRASGKQLYTIRTIVIATRKSTNALSLIEEGCDRECDSDPVLK